jgi:cytochrome P450
MPLLGGARPLVGHNPELRRDRLRLLRRLAAHPSGVVRILTPGTHACAVTSPELVQELMVDRAKDFEKSRMVRFTLYPLGGDGLFLSGGSLWRRQRKLMAPLFHPSRLDEYARDMVACAEREIASWQDGDHVDFARAMTRVTMSIAGKTLFDADTFSEADTLGEALSVALEWTSEETVSPYSIAHLVAARLLLHVSERAPARLRTPLAAAGERLTHPTFLPGARGRALRKALRVLDDRVQRMIDERRAEGLSRADLLTRLLEARDEEGGMSDKQVRDEVLTLFVAGHETTANGLAWAVYLLCNHPRIYDRVQAEVDALSGPPTVADLPRLGLTLRVFKEALRIYSPVYMIGRQAERTTSLGGYELPRHGVVLFAPWASHRREDVWPDPERFDPDRFLPEREATRHKLAYLPFGAGPRICIGNHFALMEGQLVLASLLRAARFTLVADEEAFPSATLRPKSGMPMRVRMLLHARAA